SLFAKTVEERQTAIDESHKIRRAAERAVIAAFTDEDIAKYKAQQETDNADEAARRALIKKAYENPETYEEFRIKRDQLKGGLDNLTPEQWARYDGLVWERVRAKRDAERAKKSFIEAVDIQDVEMFLIKTRHTEKGYDAWVIQLSSWLDRRDWDDLHEAAKQLGGWYSSYTNNGAVPGFWFKQEVAAREFMKILDDGCDSEAVRAEMKRISLLGAKARLKAMAQRTRERAEEELNADRKTNTARRASMAAGIQQRARNAIAFADTMQRIADALQPDVPHVLDGIRNKTHVELLGRLYRSALPYREDDDHAPEEVDLALSKVTLPDLYVLRDAIPGLVHRLEPLSNCTMLSRYLRKRYAESAQERISFLADPKRHDTDVAYAEKLVAKLGGESPWYLEDALQVRRALARMGIVEDSSLRHALRAFRSYMTVAGKESELDKAIRSLIGCKIPGFFPTPPALARRLVELADIGEDDLVVEPECGKCDIVNAIFEEVPFLKWFMGFEINHTLWKIADAMYPDTGGQEEGKPFRRIVLGDWLDQKPTGITRIIMNPPFENGQDAAHVRHAYECLAPKGRIVAVVSRGVVENTRGVAAEFQQWLEHVSAEVMPNPEGTFLSAFRPTGVSTSIIVINKGDA
ncbi:MAG: hypothetical protein ABFD96_19720, partial [Armatimonadia bacterium]